MLIRSRVRKREESLNDQQVMHKHLARLISLAVWGDRQGFNQPIQKIELLEPEAVSQSEFEEMVNKEMTDFLKSKGLI